MSTKGETRQSDLLAEMGEVAEREAIYKGILEQKKDIRASIQDRIKTTLLAATFFGSIQAILLAAIFQGATSVTVPYPAPKLYKACLIISLSGLLLVFWDILALVVLLEHYGKACLTPFMESLGRLDLELMMGDEAQVLMPFLWGSQNAETEVSMLRKMLHPTFWGLGAGIWCTVIGLGLFLTSLGDVAVYVAYWSFSAMLLGVFVLYLRWTADQHRRLKVFL